MFDGLYQYCSKIRLTKYILPQSRVKTGKPHPGVVRKPEQPGEAMEPGEGAVFFVPQLSLGVSINSKSVSSPLAGSSLWHLQFLYKRSRQGCTMPQMLQMPQCFAARCEYERSGGAGGGVRGGLGTYRGQTDHFFIPSRVMQVSCGL